MATLLSVGRGSQNILQSQRKVDMAEKVLELQPDQQPLTVFTAKLNKRPTVNAKYSWVEDDLLPRYDRINNGGGYASGATSVVVDNGTYFAADDIVYVSRTGELVQVTAVATNTLTIVRGVGSTAAALVDNDELIIIGSAQQEGANARSPKTTVPAEVINYTEIFRRSVEETKTLISSDQFTKPHDWDRQRAHISLEHQKDKELAFIFGRASEDTSGTHPKRTTAGILNYIATNQTDAGGTLTEAEFFSAMRPAFRYGSRDKLGLAAPLVVDVLNTYARGKVQVTNQDSNSYGVQVVKYMSPHGTLNVTTHWQLEGDKFAGYLIGVDLAQTAYRYLAGNGISRDTFIEENIQTPGQDARKDQIVAEVGLQFGLEKTHFVISNVTG